MTTRCSPNLTTFSCAAIRGWLARRTFSHLRNLKLSNVSKPKPERKISEVKVPYFNNHDLSVMSDANHDQDLLSYASCSYLL